MASLNTVESLRAPVLGLLSIIGDRVVMVL